MSENLASVKSDLNSNQRWKRVKKDDILTKDGPHNNVLHLHLGPGEHCPTSYLEKN